MAVRVAAYITVSAELRTRPMTPPPPREEEVTRDVHTPELKPGSCAMVYVQMPAPLSTGLLKYNVGKVVVLVTAMPLTAPRGGQTAPVAYAVPALAASGSVAP